MRVLLDNNVNVRFGKLLPGHEVIHVLEVAWDRLQNGDLVADAETDGFDVIVTADKNMRYQQNLEGRRISIVVLNSRFVKWTDIASLAPQVKSFLEGSPSEGSFDVVSPEEQ